MNPLQRLVVVCVCLLAAGPAVAQKSQSSADATSKPQHSAEKPDSAAAPPPPHMYEDIEILRRILDRTFKLPRYVQNTFPSPFTGQPDPSMAGMMGTANTMRSGMGFSGGAGFLGGNFDSMGTFYTRGSSTLVVYPEVEGVYLRGYGVVYSLTLPAGEEIRPRPAKTAPKLVSEWERTRKQLHGEKVEEEAKNEPKQNPTLTERVLKVLAENGHHFTLLGPDERLTVVITLPKTGTAGSANAAGSAAGAASGGKRVGTGAANANPGAPLGGSGDSSAAASDVAAALGYRGASSSHDYELLGDLQLKQGRTAEAIKAYERAITLQPQPRQAAEIHRKLARAYLSVETSDAQPKQVEDNLQQAEASMRQALAVYRQTLAAAEQNPPAKALTAAKSLPGKLIVSAAKPMLIEFANGKLSFEDFRQRASVEYVLLDAPGAEP